ncbi:ankyrin repeat-containing domain protein, partial [Schizophyllum commune]
EIIRLLLEKGANIEDCDDVGWTSLHLATRHWSLSTVRLLLERGANVNALSSVHRTPLHIAACEGHFEIIRLLVESGAALEARDTDGWTPLYLAARNRDLYVIELLLDLGSDPQTRADDGTTLLDAVGRTRFPCEDAVRALLIRAGCTEETERIPLENGVQLGDSDTEDGSESSQGEPPNDLLNPTKCSASIRNNGHCRPMTSVLGGNLCRRRRKNLVCRRRALGR